MPWLWKKKAAEEVQTHFYLDFIASMPVFNYRIAVHTRRLVIMINEYRRRGVRLGAKDAGYRDANLGVKRDLHYFDLLYSKLYTTNQ